MMNIMACYDGSNAAEAAVELAKTYAAKLNARVVLVTSQKTGDMEEVEKTREAEKNLARLAAALTQSGIACEEHLLIRGASAGEDLVAYAQETGFDLMVIGVRRRSKVGKMVFGSTAQYVILNAPCPVLTVR